MDKTKILRFVIFSAIILFLMWGVPFYLGLARGGFVDASKLATFQFYQIVGIVAFLIITGFWITELIIKKGDDEYGNSIGFVDQGEKPSLSIFKKMTLFQMFFFFTIIFMIFGLLNITVFVQTGVGQTTYTGVQFLPMQFSAIDSTMFSSILIPISENLAAGAIIAFSLFFLRFFSRKYKISKFNFTVLAIILVPIILGIFWIGWHGLAYPGQELALTVVFLFGLIGGMLTILTGSFVAFWSLHLINNLFIDLLRFFSNELMFIIFSIIIVIMMVAYYMLYKGRLFGGEVKSNAIQ